MTDFYDSPQWIAFGQGHPGGQEATGQLLAWGNLPPGGRLLDVCCGRGDGVALAAAQGLFAMGCDRPQVVARAQGAHPQLAFVPWQGGPLPLGPWDGILCQCSLSLLPKGTAQHLADCLTPGGVLLLSDLGAPGPLSGFSLVQWEDQSHQLRQFADAWLWQTGTRFPACDADRYFSAIYERV